MKKFINFKKVCSLAVASTLALSVVSCGGEETTTNTENTDSQNTQTSTETSTEVTKPEHIEAIVDSVFGTDMDPASWQPWVDKYKELTGIDITFTKPVHNEYYQQLSLAFTSGEIPDVAEINCAYYPTYSNNGALWNMTQAWEESDLKKSGTVDEAYVDALRIDGELYGFPRTRGGGAVTYVRQDWLDNLGLEIPTNYEEFHAVLEAFTYDDPDGNGIDDTYGITMPGLVNVEAPYAVYQREYFQDAEPDFYQKEDGTWVDGMLEPEMIDALQRMKDDYQAGLMDKEVVTNKTSTARDKVYSSQAGVFNYWAGNWSEKLHTNLTAQAPEGVLVPIPAIEETHYVETAPPAIAITSVAENPEGIFKYLIEYSHDGGEGQMLFTHGVQDVNYTLNDGVFEKLPDPENPLVPYEKAWYSNEISINTWDDPMALTDRQSESLDRLTENRVIAPLSPTNDVITQEQPQLVTIRDRIIANVVTGDLTPEEGIAQYKEEGQVHIDAILNSLNE